MRICVSSLVVTLSFVADGAGLVMVQLKLALALPPRPSLAVTVIA